MKKSSVWILEDGSKYRIDNGSKIEKDEYRLSAYDYIVLCYMQKNSLVK